MKRSLLLIGVFLFSYQCFSWDLSGIAGARSNATGSCSVSLSDFWSIQNNPAGMADYRFFSAGLSYENRFFMKELSLYDLALMMPVKIGTIGLSYSRFGFENFNENKLGLAFARAFSPYFKMGLKIDYLWPTQGYSLHVLQPPLGKQMAHPVLGTCSPVPTASAYVASCGPSA